MVSFLEMNKLMDNNVRDENAGEEGNCDGEEEEERKRGTGGDQEKTSQQRNRFSRPGLRAIDT